MAIAYLFEKSLQYLTQNIITQNINYQYFMLFFITTSNII
jgi:hypothetical protein